MTEESALTEEQINSIKETVSRRDKMIEYIREVKIKELKVLGAKLKEKQRILGNSKAKARSKSKASAKARKVNRRK